MYKVAHGFYPFTTLYIAMFHRVYENSIVYIFELIESCTNVEHSICLTESKIVKTHLEVGKGSKQHCEYGHSMLECRLGWLL